MMTGNSYLVYIHRNPTTKIPFYVGIGDRGRPSEKDGRNIFWKRYVAKYGNPIIDIFKKDLSREDAIGLEINLISILGRVGLDENGILTNRTLGGDGTFGYVSGMKGKKHTDEAKKKSSESKRGNKHPWFGKKLPERWRSNMSKAQKGRRHSAETIAKISAAALKRTNIPPKMTDAIKGKLSTKAKERCGTDEYRQMISDRCRGEKSSSAKVVLNTESGIFYGCATDAAVASGINKYYLRGMLNGNSRNKTSYIYA